MFREEDLASKLEQWMTPSPYVVREKMTLDKARDLMKKHGIHHLPVVDDMDHPCGIISAYDLALMLDWKTGLEIGEFQNINNKILGAVLVEDIMRKPATLEVQATLRDCLDLFESNEFHAILITEEEKLKGILTTHDVLFKFYDKEVIK